MARYYLQHYLRGFTEFDKFYLNNKLCIKIIIHDKGNPLNNEHIKSCVVCKIALTGKQSKYCSRKCHNKTGNFNLQSYALQQQRAKDRKLELILNKGGKCEICGYCKNYSALCFHHVDPSQKEMKLDGRKLSNSSMVDILKEVEKCQLLCNNCHMEIHHPQCTI